MIIKSYEINKINLNTNHFFLLHGKNEGLKNEVIKNLTKTSGENLRYEEKEVLNNENNFIENILSKSLLILKDLLLLRELQKKS